MDSLVLKYYSTMLNRTAYKFHLNRQFDCDPKLVFESMRADNDRIGVSESIDSHANAVPVRVSKEKTKIKRFRFKRSDFQRDQAKCWSVGCLVWLEFLGFQVDRNMQSQMSEQYTEYSMYFEISCFYVVQCIHRCIDLFMPSTIQLVQGDAPTAKEHNFN